jgi:hypothetical protein
METPKGYGRLECSGCGESLSDRTLWVDDCGLLCRHCAMLTRYRRMKGEGHSWEGQKGSGVVYRSPGQWRRIRQPVQGTASPREND